MFHKDTINYGLLLALVTIVIFAVTVNMDPQSTTVKILSWVNYLAGFIIIYLAIVNFRNKNGKLTIGQGFKTGLAVGLIAGVLLGLYAFLYYQYINPDAVERIMELSREQMAEKGLDEELIEKNIEFTRNFFGMFAFAGSIINMLFIGILSGLAVGVWKRTE